MLKFKYLIFLARTCQLHVDKCGFLMSTLQLYLCTTLT